METVGHNWGYHKVKQEGEIQQDQGSLIAIGYDDVADIG